eukprot:CAMPEP_0183296194 /NCGR_PEP_ID=MMETSP0160_2-20130417/3862_1 /TAXON_ID=2839 ORGANISM="Odontella Sinensis, Strain Grunow 1884" /NCGR_SAMPLE_ID=MMETSP0160_2 /ASSEMBLY_ACC=CAM_ASM_000250 /LENGTH=282 /DNA_ID=CAMNT_0025457787 /DNA_START=66 /DNA_END=914 /DNA_ORIENTATION=+
MMVMRKETNQITGKHDDDVVVQGTDVPVEEDGIVICDEEERDSSDPELEDIHEDMELGLFTLVVLLCSSLDKRHGAVFKLLLFTSSMFVLVAMVILFSMLAKVVAMFEWDGSCTGDADKYEKLTMFGVSGLYTSRFIMLGLEKHDRHMKERNLRSRGKQISRMCFLLSIDEAWDCVVVGAVHLLNLWIVFITAGTSSMIFNALAVEFIIGLKDETVGKYTGAFGIDKQVLNDAKRRPLSKVGERIFVGLQKSSLMLSILCPILSLWFMVYGTICKPLGGSWG